MGNEIALVIVAVIGVLGTLGGAIAGPFLQRKHEEWKAKRADQQLLRDKAQEPFDELDRLTAQAHGASVSAAQLLNDPEAEIQAAPDLGRIRAITAVYFPECEGPVLAFENKVTASGAKTINLMHEFQQNDTLTGDSIRAITLSHVSQHHNASQELAKALRKQISLVVPRLEV